MQTGQKWRAVCVCAERLFESSYTNMDALRIRFHYVYAAISHNKRSVVGAGRERRRVHGSAWDGRRCAGRKGSNNENNNTRRPQRRGEVSEEFERVASGSARLHALQHEKCTHTHTRHSAGARVER